MKKGILLILILSLVTQISFAVEVGYVDITKVVNNYALAQKYKNEVNNKFKSVSAFIDQQNKEVNSAKDEKTRIEKRKKAIAAVEAKQKEYLELRRKREAEIDLKIKQAADKVRIEKKLDIVVKKDSALAGGIDITQDIINRLK